MSDGENFTGPWNEGRSTHFGEDWQVIKDPIKHVRETDGLLTEEARGTHRTEQMVQDQNRELSKERKEMADKAKETNDGLFSWSSKKVSN